MVSNNAIYSKKYAPCPRPFSKYEWEWNLVSCPNLAHFLHFPSWIFSTKRTLFNNVVHALSTQQWLLGDTKGCIDLIESDNRNKMHYLQHALRIRWIYLVWTCRILATCKLVHECFLSTSTTAPLSHLSSHSWVVKGWTSQTEVGVLLKRFHLLVHRCILHMNWFQSAAKSFEVLVKNQLFLKEHLLGI